MSSTIQEGLQKAAQRSAPKERAAKKASAKKTKAKQPQASRAGTVLIGGHFDPSVKQRLLKIRAEHPERTTQDLLTEALDMLFERHKQPRIR